MNSAAGATGIAVYSRTGHSKRVAERLAEALDATVIDIDAPAYGAGPVGYVRAAIDSLRQGDAKLKDGLPSLSGFQRVILCGPVWTSYPATPIRTVLRGRSDLPRSVSLFLTSGAHSPAEKAFKTAVRDLGHPLAAVASLPNGKAGSAEEDRIVEEFLKDLETIEHLPG